MELGGGSGGGGFWDLSSALIPAPPLLPFSQRETMVLHGGLPGMPAMGPHLTCLNLGKRHYFEDAGERPHPSADHLLGGKKGRVFGGGSSSSSSLAAAAAPVPRCQVEGCSMLLVHAKDYHRRHKVCEMHSKAPKVVVLGLEQRFCQQCSRFHVVSEFDDTKRSCRRRLAGHNERRRKNSNESMEKINNPQDHRAAGGRYQCRHPSPEGVGALSLLSSTSYASDLSRRSSAALRELIAENRAAVIAGQLFSNQPTCPHPFFATSQVPGQAPQWSSHFQEHVTLNLMQTPASSSYPPLTPGGPRRAKENDECCDTWKSLEGARQR